MRFIQLSFNLYFKLLEYHRCKTQEISELIYHWKGTKFALDKVLNEVETVDRMCPLSSKVLVSELLIDQA
jgi:hypothetical protein